MTRQNTAPLSVVIPVYNDASGIAQTLDSLTAQSTKGDYEIAVVDNNSTDQTPEVINSYDDDRITLYHETEIQSSYAARNTGIRNTESEILAFVDADMTVPEHWLENALDTFHSTDADYIGCNVDLTLPDNPPLPARFDYHTGFPIDGYLRHQQFAPTCCLFVRRAVFEDVGLFDHRLISGGDKEFGNRAHDAGYSQHYAADVTMSHPTRNSLADLVSKDRRVGRGLCQLQRYHPDRYGTPRLPPRPTGIKRPSRTLPLRDRLAFSALSTILTGVRGVGYYQEYASDDPHVDDEIPHVDKSK